MVVVQLKTQIKALGHPNQVILHVKGFLERLSRGKALHTIMGLMCCQKRRNMRRVKGIEMFLLIITEDHGMSFFST